MKIVVNKCYGGFSLSRAAVEHMAAAGCERARLEIAEHNRELAAFAYYKANGKLPEGRDEEDFTKIGFDICIKYNSPPRFHGFGNVEGMDGYGYERNDPLLAAAVESLGDAANGEHAKLRVVEIPDGTDYEIAEYDGMEHIAEKHRTW